MNKCDHEFSSICWNCNRPANEILSELADENAALRAAVGQECAFKGEKSMKVSEKVEQIIDKYIDPENGFDHDDIMVEVRMIEEHNAALKALLREYMIRKTAYRDPFGSYIVFCKCPVCYGEWQEGEPEAHDKSCRYIAAVGGMK